MGQNTSSLSDWISVSSVGAILGEAVLILNDSAGEGIWPGGFGRALMRGSQAHPRPRANILLIL